MWRLYLWCYVFQVIVGFRTAWLEGSSILSWSHWLMLLVGLVGLKGYIDQQPLFRQWFWKLFFGLFTVWNLFYIFLSLYSHSQSSALLIQLYHGCALLLLLPQFLALYRYSYRSWPSNPVVKNHTA